jgi:drug/metabolite transporter (DMT)-like permease
MNAYLLIVIAYFVFTVNSYLSFTKAIHIKWWFTYALVSCSMTVGFIWSQICRGASTPREIYTLSAIWDFMIMFTFYVMPIFFTNIKLNWQTVAGVLLVFIGCVIVKLGENNG